MSRVSNQFKSVAFAFEALSKAVGNAPYNYEVDERLAELQEELMVMSLTINTPHLDK